MTNYLVKLRLVFVPFLLFLLIAIGVYTFLHWLLLIKFSLFEIEQSVVNILIPSLLIILFALPILGNRLQFLYFRVAWLYNVVLGFAIFLITFCTAATQYYMVTAATGNTVLQTIDELSHHAPGRYYTIANGYVATERAQHHLKEITRKRFRLGRRVTELQLYVVAPIVASATDRTITSKAWIGKNYKATIKKRKADNNDKQQFLHNSLQQFAKEDFQNYSYFEKPAGSSDADLYRTALKQDGNPIVNTIILEPKYQSFKERQHNQLLMMLCALGVGITSFALLLIVTPLNKWHTRVLFMLKPEPQPAIP